MKKILAGLILLISVSSFAMPRADTESSFRDLLSACSDIKLESHLCRVAIRFAFSIGLSEEFIEVRLRDRVEELIFYETAREKEEKRLIKANEKVNQIILRVTSPSTPSTPYFAMPGINRKKPFLDFMDFLLSCNDIKLESSACREAIRFAVMIGASEGFIEARLRSRVETLISYETAREKREKREKTKEKAKEKTKEKINEKTNQMILRVTSPSTP